jgi:transposase
MSTFKATLSETFCLDGLLLDTFKNYPDHMDVFVRSPRTHARCPRCPHSTNKIHKRSKRRVKHMICNDKIVYLEIALRSFRCRECFYIFQESILGVCKKSTTLHFRQSALKKIANRSFTSVATDHGLSCSTLIREAKNIFENYEIQWPEKKFCLGIDEHSFSGRDLVITITDVTNRKLLTILFDDRQATLRRFIHNIPEKTKKLIDGVCIDMKQSYRSVVESELSKLVLVVDKFHVIQYFNFHLSQFRTLYTSSSFPLPKQLLEKNKEDLTKEEKDALKGIFKKYPPIGELWKMKEIIRRMYRSKNIQKAMLYYHAMMDGLQHDARPRWQTIYRTLKRWEEPILNYFRKRITNAFTEGCHTKIKLLKRISYGFKNKTHYIAKMTLGFLPAIAILELFSSP